MSRLFTPLIQLFNASGATAGAGTITFFAQGTTTLQGTFQDAARTLANENPLTVDGSGLSPTIYLQYLNYTILAQDSDGVTLWEKDFDGRWLADGSDYTRSGTGGVARTVQAKLEDYVTVFDYMTTTEISDVVARTAGVDVTVAIQSALDDMSSGGTLFFPGGVYLVSKNGSNNWCIRNITNNMTLYGYGAEIKETVGSVQILRSVSADNFSLIGMKITGIGSVGTDLAHGIVQINTSDNVRVIDCNIDDSDADGLATATCTNVHVVSNSFNNNSKASLYVNASTDSEVVNNTITNASGHTSSGSTVGAGIQLSSNTNLTCSGNIVRDGIGYGIFCSALSGGARPLRNTITGNTVYNNANAANVNVSGGINLVNSNATKDCGTIISDNLCWKNGIFNIRVENHDGAKISGNNCIESVRSNIVISTINDASVTGNICINTNTSDTASQAAIITINDADGVWIYDNRYIDSSAFVTSFGAHASIDGGSGTNIVTGRRNAVATFVDSDTTPSVVDFDSFLTNTTGVTIARFDDGFPGQQISIISKGVIVYDTSPANRLIGSTVDITTASGDITTWVCETGGTTSSVWRLTGFVDISVDNSAGA